VDAFRTIYTLGADALTPDESRMLIERHHWFGRLATSYGLPSDDPRRAAAMVPARRSVLVMGGGFVLALGALVCGIALAILAIMLMQQRRIVAAYTPAPPWVGGRFVEAFALYLAGMVGLSLALARLFPRAGLSATFLLFALLPVAMVYLRLRGVEWSEILRGLGWHRGRGVLREIGAGLYGYIAGLPLLAVGVVTTLILMKVTGNTPTHPIVNEPVDRPMEVLQLVLLACVGAPIVEETMFRGALLGHLRTRLGWWISAPIVSILFAAIHPQGWVAIPTLGAIAMVLAALREVRGSIIASMTAHALNNSVAVMMMVMLMK
jgi:membrane protease YdiL (CAAX protease family)